MASNSIPSEFRYIGIKFIADRHLLSTRIPQGTWVQLAELEFCTNDESEVFDVKGTSTLELHSFYKRRHLVSYPTFTIADTQYYNAGGIGGIFDGSVYEKMYRGVYNCVQLADGTVPGYFDVSDNAHKNVLGFGNKTYYGNSLELGGWESDYAQLTTLLGGTGHTPFTVVVDLGSENTLNIEHFGTWRFFNANDNASQTYRTWVWGEIIGSNDGKRWWLLDSFKDLGITNSNFAMAYKGSLSVKGKGDLTSNLNFLEWE
jgi:hypothetical protein